MVIGIKWERGGDGCFIFSFRDIFVGYAYCNIGYDVVYMMDGKAVFFVDITSQSCKYKYYLMHL